MEAVEPAGFGSSSVSGGVFEDVAGGAGGEDLVLEADGIGRRGRVRSGGGSDERSFPGHGVS